MLISLSVLNAYDLSRTALHACHVSHLFSPSKPILGKFLQVPLREHLASRCVLALLYSDADLGSAISLSEPASMAV